MGMLTGRQLLQYRQMKMIHRKDLAKRLAVTENDVIIYEYQLKPIPAALYTKWLTMLK